MGTRRRQFAHEHSHVFLSRSRRSASVAHELYVSSTFPKDRFRLVLLAFLLLSLRIASVAHGCVFLPRSPKLSFPLHTVVWFFHIPEGLLPSHTVVRFFHVPEGSFPSRTPYVSSVFPKDHFRRAWLCVPSTIAEAFVSVTHGCVVLPHSRRNASVAYACAFLPHLRRDASVTHGCTVLPRLRRVVSVAHGCTFLPHSRRIASVPYALRFFHPPEGLFPSRTAPLPFCQRLRKALSVCREKVCLARHAVHFFPRYRPKPNAVPSVVQQAWLSSVQNLTPGRVHSGLQRALLTWCIFHDRRSSRFVFTKPPSAFLRSSASKFRILRSFIR